MLCQECEKRDSCRELCPKAEAYANQDWVGPSDNVIYVDPKHLEWLALELPLSAADMECLPLGDEEWAIAKASGLTEKQEACVHAAFWELCDQRTIAERLEISQPTVLQHIAYAKKKILKKCKNKSLYR